MYWARRGRSERLWPLPWASSRCQISRSPALPGIGFTVRPSRSGREGVAVLRLGLHPLLEHAVEARHALEAALVLGGVGQVEDPLHAEADGLLRGVHVPVESSPCCSHARPVLPRRRLHVGAGRGRPTASRRPRSRRRPGAPSDTAGCPRSPGAGRSPPCRRWRSARSGARACRGRGGTSPRGRPGSISRNSQMASTRRSRFSRGTAFGTTM